MPRIALCPTLCALAALALPAAASAAPVTLVATLTGPNETGGGEPAGKGTFKAQVDPEKGDFCYSLSAAGIGKPTMAHVHSGAVGADGPPVVTLEVSDDECQAVEPDVLKPIVAAPGDYYVNVHSAAFPKGAIRGQLQLSK